jgi:GH15 family glucan-1,4-alpha-glucosidase
MPRSLVLGNGAFTVCLDEYGFVRDMFYPYVGLENHVLGKKHRIGVMVNELFSWLDDGTWEINLGYKPETMVGQLVCKNERLQLSLVMEDAVYNEVNVFLRQVDVYNHADVTREVKLFFGQEFQISENKQRNTGFYDPTHATIVHYKGCRVFVIDGRTTAGTGIDDYTIGMFDFDGKEGSFRDAEDGKLSHNAVEHGPVDSVVRFSLTCESKLKSQLFYWICAGENLDEAFSLNSLVHTKKPENMIHSTEQFWNAWLNKQEFDLAFLNEEQKKLFDTSLLILRGHTDNRGGIVASLDSTIMEFGKDDYAYMWPRDASFIAMILDKAGYTEVTKPFFTFCQHVLHPDGYLHHRFRTDESLGSTWHSTTSQKEWLKDKILQLPIQEDESASVLFALWNHYECTKDIEYIETAYKPFIEKIANFLVAFRDQETHLPLRSYDLWEEKIGISTYTCASVYGALHAAANFSELLGKRNHMRIYRDAALEVKEAMKKHLFNEKLQSFIRVGYLNEGKVTQEEIVDASSLFGLWYFGVMDEKDPQFAATEKAVDSLLLNANSPIGGIIRYQHDQYFKSTDVPNPWIITTLWQAERMLKKEVVTDEIFAKVRDILEWVTKTQTSSGVLPEQLQPYTGAPLSATPLVWSHAVYVETILMYIERMKERENT